MKKSVAIFVMWVSVFAIAASAAGGYHLLQKVSVPEDGGFDYCTVDSINRRVYISHSTHVVVMDADSHKLVGKIDKTDGVHGIAIALDLNRGFTSNGRAGTSTIFDLKTLNTLGEVKLTGEDPDGISYDPATRRVFTSNRGSSSITAIDAVEGKVAGTIQAGGRPEFSAADGKGHAFFNIVDKDVVMQIDSRTLEVLGRWPVAPCEGPGSMAIDRKNGRLFVGCRNKLMAILDATNGRKIAMVPIGEGRDAAVFDPETGLVYSSNGQDGNVTVIRQESPDRYSVLETVATEAGARTMALDWKTHKMFLPAADRGPTPAAPSPDNPRARAPVVPGTFRVLVFGM